MAYNINQQPPPWFRLRLLSILVLLLLSIFPHFAPRAMAQSGTTQTKVTKTATTDPVQAVIRIEVSGGNYVDFGETESRTFGGHGSGFLIDSAGHAVTNHHVVSGATSLKVYVGDSDTPYYARVVGVNECADLAVIQIQGDNFPYLEWYPDPVARRLSVEASGFPLDATEVTFTPGIISSTQAEGQTSWASLPHVLLHSAVINPGNSGGPLVDTQGRVVGINYAGNSASNQYFAIDHELAQPLIEQLRQGTDVEAIGVNGEAFVLENGATRIWVYSVKPGSPADRAEIHAGDIISSLGGLPLGRNGTLQNYCDVIRSHSTTDTIDVEVHRLSSKAECVGQINGRALRCSTNSDRITPTATPIPTSKPVVYRKFSVENGVIVFDRPQTWQDANVSLWKSAEETIGLTVETAPNLEDFRKVWNSSGLSVNVSRVLADRMTTTELLDQYAYNNSCTFVRRKNFQRSGYTGHSDFWEHCGGAENANLLVAAFTPADKDFIALVIFQSASEAELSMINHVVDTLTVNFAAITDPTPTATPRPRPTATPQPVMATVLVPVLNVRTGPGTNYPAIATARQGQSFPLIGQVNNCAWVMIRDSAGLEGWIAAGNQYARVDGSCGGLGSGKIVAGTGRTPPSTTGTSNEGCINFQNQINTELTITFTGKTGQGSRTFKVASHGAQRQCFAPGSYTYTLDAPPPLGSSNGELTIQGGATINFPISARD